MGLLLILAVLVAAFILWVAWHVLYFLPRPILVWVLVLATGVVLTAAGAVPHTPLGHVLVEVWAYGVTLVPPVWLVTTLVRWMRRD